MFIQLDFQVSLAFIIFCLFGTGYNKKCHSFYGNTKYYLSTKTPYSYVSNNDYEPYTIEGCTPIRIWALVRHGTRNPGGKIVDMRIHLSMLKTILIGHHESKKGNLCPDEVDRLRAWQTTVDPSELKHLTHEGEEEMLLLGERFQARFPSLLPELYSNKTYKFRHTATQRARESSRHFTIGLFGRKQANHIWYPEPLAKDPVLRFYKLCKKWRKEVDKNPKTYLELEKFKTKPLVMQMLENVSQRIGLSNQMKFDDARLIYQMCCFETAWHPNSPSPWCAVFSKEDLEILEYAEDLKYYWVDGYGFPLTYNQACVAISDMFHHLTDDSHPANTFYFSHSGTILKVLCRLGLYRDPHPLTADLFNKTRLWRTSNIDVFGSNIAFILYKCQDEYKVLTLHQERPITIPGCPEDDLCPLELFEEVLQESLERCNFNEMCEVES